MTMLDWLFGALAVLAGAVAALVGFGIGSLLTPALALTVGTKVAVAMVAVPHIVATATRLWVLRASIDRGVLLGFGLASAVGGLAGAVLHATLGSSVLGGVLGALLILAGTSELLGLGRRFRISGNAAIVAGALSGAFGGLVGNQGGIRSAALLRFDLSRESLVATATATALLVDFARLPVYAATMGAEMLREWPTLVVLTGGALVGTFVGAPILRRVPDAVFRRVLALLLIALGAWLLVGIGA
jgi:uncharacterized membrane protein YfcA